MTFAEAKEIVLRGISTDIATTGAPVIVQANPANEPDEAKFMINGKLARVVSFFSGWHVPINLKWFSGSFDQPQIQDSSFYWYALLPDAWKISKTSLSHLRLSPNAGLGS